MATNEVWSRNCNAVAGFLICAPYLLRQRYLPEIPGYAFVGWILFVWLGAIAVLAMGALQVPPRRLPFLKVLGFSALLLAVIGLFLLSMAGLQRLVD
ncbi:hypothetical protein [Aquimonas sp.]|uniref:hypothetical protein n=1 Tax=Aquimonas sp. TaxID=1872588 RepID=UPI0037C0D15A